MAKSRVWLHFLSYVRRAFAGIWWLFALPVAFWGCESGTTGSYTIKTRGVYTTLASPELHALDMPASGYVQVDKFGPGQTPVVVVTGYDNQRVTLEVIEVSTGQLLYSDARYIGAGMASYQGLSISKSGDYEAQVLLGGRRLDSFKFSVTRDDGTRKPDTRDTMISRMDAALQINPENAEAYYHRGQAYAAKGQSDKAIADFSEAIRLVPENSHYYQFRGLAYFRIGKLDKAIDDYTQAIRLVPTDAGTFAARGLAYKKQAQYRKALEDFLEAVRLNPASPRERNELAWLFMPRVPWQKSAMEKQP